MKFYIGIWNAVQVSFVAYTGLLDRFTDIYIN